MQTTFETPSMIKIMQTGTAFMSCKVFQIAIDLDLFTHLAKQGPTPIKDIRTKYDWNCSLRHSCDFLDTLVTLGFLEREGILESSVYSNAKETATYLDKSQPGYIGGFIAMCHKRLYGFWDTLEEGLRTGKPQSETKRGENFFGNLYSDQEKLKVFVHAMKGINLPPFRAFARAFDFSKYKTLSDIGGSGATLSISVAEVNKHLTCTSYDLAPVEGIAKELIEEAGLSERVKAGSIDFLKDPLPESDLITMSLILHDWDEDTKTLLLKKAYDAIKPGGALVVIENIIDDERRSNAGGLLMSLNMLIEVGFGFDFSFKDFEKWAKDAGFKKTELIQLVSWARAVVAYKDAN